MFRKLASIFGAGAPQPQPTIKLAAFGKHPGWMDHMEELGLETDLLVSLRRMLYSEGINQNIDGGAWSGQEPGQVIERFHHVFAWGVDRDIIVGRLWSSSDGRGRKLYPMIVCAHCTGMPFDRAFEIVLPLLSQLEDRLVATDDPDEVRTIIRTFGSKLQVQAEQKDEVQRGESPKSALGRLADRDELGPEREGLLRVLYEIDRDILGAGTHSGETWSSTGEIGRASHVRVPYRGDDEVEGAALWLEFLVECVNGSAPVLVLLPLGQSWLDVIVGDASASQLSCLRATPERVPLTSTIPYSFDDDFLARANGLIEESISRIGEKTS